MIYVVCGEISSGKTTRMMELYRKTASGTADGLISRRIYRSGVESSFLPLEKESSEADADNLIGYELVRLSTGESRLLVMLASCYHGQFKRSFRFNRFVFSQDGFGFGESVIQELLENELILDIFIDEIGLVELQGQGFCRILEQSLLSDKNLWLAIRSGCQEEVLDKFGVKNWELR